MSYPDFETEGRRLVILRILSRRNQFTTNEYSLNDELKGAYAHNISRLARRTRVGDYADAPHRLDRYLNLTRC